MTLLTSADHAEPYVDPRRLLRRARPSRAPRTGRMRTSGLCRPPAVAHRTPCSEPCRRASSEVLLGYRTAGTCAITTASRPGARDWLASLAALEFCSIGRGWPSFYPGVGSTRRDGGAQGGARVGYRHCGGQRRGPVRRAAAGPGRAPGPCPGAGLSPACPGRGIRRFGGVPPVGAADRPAAYCHGQVPSAAHRAAARRIRGPAGRGGGRSPAADADAGLFAGHGGLAGG